MLSLHVAIYYDFVTVELSPLFILWVLPTFRSVGFWPLFILWDFVLWDVVRRDFVQWDSARIHFEHQSLKLKIN